MELIGHDSSMWTSNQHLVFQDSLFFFLVMGTSDVTPPRTLIPIHIFLLKPDSL